MARAGQALVEYILLIALVAIVMVASLFLFRGGLNDRLEDVTEAVDLPRPGQPQPGDNPPGGPIPPGLDGPPPGQGGTNPGKGRG
jgi:Flp pilus assembly pilin Flp